jgi:D-glycero-D-manno-heptose 1,7-bisphosphate phosphatase
VLVKRRAVFLDRDGVVNAALVRDGKPYSPATPDELVLLPGVEAALAQLRDAGFVRVVVTNQPDIARGKTTRAQIDAMHDKVRGLVDAIYMCPHDDGDRCACRKPLPGMLLDAARDLDLDLAGSIVVGDRWRDIAAGAAAGCRTVFVDYGYDEQRPASFDHRASSLAEAIPWIIGARH